MTIDPLDKIRVLIADDSFFMRTYLTEILRTDNSFDVVGTASSGDEVIILAHELKPDVITMDYHMPGKNGVESIADIMLGDRPLPAIIMLSAFSGEDGQNARKILEESGAHIIVKPSGEVSLDMEKVAGEVIKKIKDVGMIEVKIRKAYTRMHHVAVKREAKKTTQSSPFRGLLVIGASTGGPPLVEHLLAELDPDSGISIVVVQHMSQYFTELFANRLNRVTKFHVREARNGDAFLPGVALVVPGGHSLVSIDEDEIGLCALTLKKSTRDAREVEIDNTMATVARCFSGPVVGVLLSGMGKDGASGLKAINKYGGVALVQDPETATVSAMPYHAIHETGAEVVALENLPMRIMSCLQVK